MENSYGIGVQNRYGMFIDDDADPFDIIKRPVALPKASEEKENKTKTKTAVKKTIKSDVNGKSDKTNGVSKPAQTQSRNSENRVKFSDREERNNRRNRQEGPRESNNGTVGQRFDGEERPRRRFEDGNQRREDGNQRRDDGNQRRDDGNQRREDGTQRREDGTQRRDDGGTQRRDDGGTQRRFNDGGAPRRFNDGERRFDGEGRGGRGRGMGRGGRGGRGARRDFDRHSGSERSGIKSVDKREGSGSYNWGSAKEQIDETQLSDQMQATDGDASAEDKEKVATGEEATAASDNDSGAENAGPKEPEEPKEMTLDEYKAMQKASRVKPEFNVRKAGEGENNSQWKKTYILKKKIEESDEEESEEDEEYEDTHQKKKVVLNIDFQFSDSPMRGGRGRGRGGRGSMGGRGRGEGRGGRGMGGASRGGSSFNRGGRNSKQEAPKMDDEGDFPSLSGRK